MRSRLLSAIFGAVPATLLAFPAVFLLAAGAANVRDGQWFGWLHVLLALLGLLGVAGAWLVVAKGTSATSTSLCVSGAAAIVGILAYAGGLPFPRSEANLLFLPPLAFAIAQVVHYLRVRRPPGAET